MLAIPLGAVFQIRLVNTRADFLGIVQTCRENHPSKISGMKKTNWNSIAIGRILNDALVLSFLIQYSLCIILMLGEFYYLLEFVL